MEFSFLVSTKYGTSESSYRSNGRRGRRSVRLNGNKRRKTGAI
jgi:hypothetical protein